MRKALILAAGEGTRLRPVTYSRPKALVEIARVALLDHTLALLHTHGVREVAINLHYRPADIPRFAGDGSDWGLQITYLEEPTLLGSGGTIRALRDFLSETFFLIYGDVLTDVDLTALADRHRGAGADLTCLLHRVPDPWNKGVAELGEGGCIRRFVEKPPRGEEPGNLVAAGVYVAEPSIIDVIPEGVPCDFGTDAVPALLSCGLRIAGEVLPDSAYLRDIGTHDEYTTAQADAATGRIHLLPRTAAPG
ncbi:MAG: nucleotidyltransferase family protein [Chloroflexi bacterium]|nr:nucleotidyltransferase family protein [Chloroflexota bacterium]